ncbi:MAG: dual specificity protein phosphatase family protein [Chitinispirillales bacterium]|nr:dual specificity protein phosphatase family protein [Chitinispirillales bacterium]
MSVDNFSWVIPQKIAGCAIPDFTALGKNSAAWLADQGVSMLVSFVMPYGLPEEECAQHGIEWIYYPIPDFDIPEDPDAFLSLIDTVVDAMKNEKGVCVHCYAGIGRTGMALACIVGRYLALSADQAIATVRKARTSIETEEQLEFIRQFLDDR